MSKYKFVAFLLFLFIQFLVFSVCNAASPSGNNWHIEVRYVKTGTINIYSDISSDAEVTGHFYYLDKILIVINPSETPIFGWYKTIYPQNGFVKAGLLITPEEKHALDIRFKNKAKENKYSQWGWKIRRSNKDYAFIKKSPKSSSPNAGILKDDDKVLFIPEENPKGGLWTKIIYPINGYVRTKDIQMIKNNTQITLGFSYGGKNIPYERNLSNYSNPLGGFIEISKSTWFVSLGFGYNYSEANIADYILKTNLAYLYLKYRIKLFNDNLELYTQAGAGYWAGTFQNTKYPSLTSYFH